MIDPDIAALLDAETRRINSPEFIADDPVQFPRRFAALQDIEIAGLLCATIAWGNRKMICRNCERLLALMDYAPAAYMADEGYEDLPDDLNIHRTFFGRNLKHYLRGLRAIYSRHGSLDAFAAAAGCGASVAPAWLFAEALAQAVAEANGGRCDTRCLPANFRNTALKRINMWLRWMVRTDGIVDLGAWRSLTPAQLYIPLDVHVNATARNLGLITRRSSDRRAVDELTAQLRTLRPDDPAVYDFALFGLGMGI